MYTEEDKINWAIDRIKRQPNRLPTTDIMVGSIVKVGEDDHVVCGLQQKVVHDGRWPRTHLVVELSLMRTNVSGEHYTNVEPLPSREQVNEMKRQIDFLSKCLNAMMEQRNTLRRVGDKMEDFIRDTVTIFPRRKNALLELWWKSRW